MNIDWSKAPEGATPMQDGEADWETPCANCDSVPTVNPIGLCGPCCFGEADTAGGNW